MNSIEYEHRNVLSEVLTAIKNGSKSIFVLFPTGMGKSRYIEELTKILSNDKSVLVVFNSNISLEQYKKTYDSTENNRNVEAELIYNLNPNSISQNDIIIVEEMTNSTKTYLNHIKDKLVICFSSLLSSSDLMNFDKIITDIFPVNDFSINEWFVKSLLSFLGFSQLNTEGLIKFDNRIYRPDFVARLGDNDYIIETKRYRNFSIDISNLLRAVQQIESYKIASNNYYHAILIIFCEVKEDVIRDIYDRYNIVIWDIHNLIYLCKDNENLQNQLRHITPYSLTNVLPKKPIKDTRICYNEEERIVKYEALELKEKLKACKTGTANSVNYENICYDIINYLFEDAFSAVKKQSNTADKMFRMDLLCSIKRGQAFWDFISEYYKTIFVVFESKNYKDKIDQNLIYITEKYLFSPALRNVAIIISRKGFNRNAKKAAEGILKEHNKLILDITDKDLLKMIEMKDSGEEPSDYLYSKTEKFLMDISK